LDYAGERRGFGHLNAYATRLLLQSVAEVMSKDLSENYDPKEYSTDPVRFPAVRIYGKVIGPDGRPVWGLNVMARSTEDVPLFMREFVEHTDEKGRFEIEVPPGRYHVGINVFYPPSPEFPYPPTYYPGTADLTLANHIAAKDRMRVRLDFRLSAMLKSKVFPVEVRWPDGKAVANANVWLSEAADPETVVGHAVSHTDAQGIFDLKGMEGIDYIVHADIYVRPGYVRHCADSVAVKAGQPLPSRLLLRLTRSGAACQGL
jgi:hypothetical protein